MNRETTIETFRAAVLAALDNAARETFGAASTGWTDRDLPNLFAALDGHTETLAERFKVKLTD